MQMCVVGRFFRPIDGRKSLLVRRSFCAHQSAAVRPQSGVPEASTNPGQRAAITQHCLIDPSLNDGPWNLHGYGRPSGLPAGSRGRSRSVSNLELTRSFTCRAAELPPNRKPSSLLAHLLEDLLVERTAQPEILAVNQLVQDWFEREQPTTKLGPPARAWPQAGKRPRGQGLPENRSPLA